MVVVFKTLKTFRVSSIRVYMASGLIATSSCLIATNQRQEISTTISYTTDWSSDTFFSASVKIRWSNRILPRVKAHLLGRAWHCGPQWPERPMQGQVSSQTLQNQPMPAKVSSGRGTAANPTLRNVIAPIIVRLCCLR